MNREGWRPVSLGVLTRATRAGWVWTGDPTRPGGTALKTPRGAIYLLRWRPMAIRRFEPEAMRDAA